ncbi:MFS transporter, partial [Candidatus Stoquefichus massiliensis]|uniref:MFS transporter n=1 Tax=Candidatus Stoquefichus massiliensis TaxID=1470350 RepID=UPI00048533FB
MKDKNILKFQAFYFLLIGAVGCFTPYINVYLENSIGLNGSQIGLITAISLILGVCVIPLWGIIGDKTRKYNLLLMFSLAASIVVLYFYSKQTVYLGCVIFALLLEVVRLGSTPMADTIAMNYTAKTNGNYGSIRGMGSLGYMLGSMAVGFLADIFGLDGPLFTSYMILLGVALLICFTFPKADEKEAEKEKPKKGNFKDLLLNKNFLFMLILVIMTQIVVDSSGAYAGNHLITTLKGDNSLISWLTFVQVLPEFLFLMIATRVIKKLGYKKFFLLATIPMALRMFTYALVPNSYVFVIVSIVHCLGVACSTVASLAYIQETVNPAVFGTAVTLLNAAMNIGKAIFGYVFGNVYQYYGSYNLFLIGAIIVTLAIVMILFTKRLDIDQVRI